MPKLFIICGHGGNDPGAIGYGYTEAERVRTLAEKIKEFGGNSVTIGNTSVNWYKNNMVNNGNIPKGSLVLELHMDSNPSSGPRGAHVIIDADYKPDVYDEALAEFISGVLPGRAQKIVGRNDLANLNRAQAAGINYRILECGFISNANDLNIFNSRIDEIAKGILKCFDIEVESKNQNNQPWYQEAQNWVKELGISDGTRPNDSATRAEVWTMLYSLYKKIK